MPLFAIAVLLVAELLPVPPISHLAVAHPHAGSLPFRTVGCLPRLACLQIDVEEKRARAGVEVEVRDRLGGVMAEEVEDRVAGRLADALEAVCSSQPSGVWLSFACHAGRSAPVCMLHTSGVS